MCDWNFLILMQKKVERKERRKGNMGKHSKKARAAKRSLAVLLVVLLLIPSTPLPAVWAEENVELEQTEESMGQEQESVTAAEEGGDAAEPEGGEETTVSGEQPAPSGEEEMTIPGEQPAPEGGEETTVSGERPAPSGEEETTIPGEQPAPEGGEETTAPGEQPAPLGGEETTIPGEQPAPSGGEETTVPGEQPAPEGGEETTVPGEQPAPSGGEEIAVPGEQPVLDKEDDSAVPGDTIDSGEDVMPDSVSENAAVPAENVVLDSVSENTTEAEPLPDEETLQKKENQLEKMILHVGGDEIVVYPEEKDAADDGGASAYSLQPLEEKEMKVDLKGYTPAELTMVSAEYILKNGEKADAGNIVWKERGYGDDYTVSAKGDNLDLSWYTASSGSSDTSHDWEMILGSADQLDTGNIRYQVTIEMTDSSKWLIPKAYQQDSTGNKTDIAVNEGESYYYDRSYYGRSYSSERDLWIRLESGQIKEEDPVYVTLAVNNAVFANPHYSSFKIFEGKFTSAAEAESQKEITEEICNSGWVTMVTYGGDGAATGCLPFWIAVTADHSNNRGDENNCIFEGNFSAKNGTEWDYDIVETSSQNTVDGCDNYIYTLYAEYPAENTYYYGNMDYWAGKTDDSAVTAAYAGQYKSIAEASAAGAENIKESLFNDSADGYPADYSKGVYFTIFVGEDGTVQEVYRCCITVKTGTRPQKVKNDATYLRFSGLKDAAGETVTCYQASMTDDSYGDRNFYTMLVENTVDLTKLAPEFNMLDGTNLYAENQLQVSGVSVHDFSKGAVQYTASSESKNISENYWLQIVHVSSGKRLYINSLDDAEANTREENGIIYSIREMLLDSAHNYRHDILLLNTGTQDIENLAVELVSDTVELDEYWTLSGKNKLSAVTTVKRNKYYGELSNMAKLRLRKKDSVAEGTEVQGTLTIKSGSETLMVLTLTGVIGAPSITTETVPQGVKYVPYGIMIQNNNKYNRNKVSYSLLKGSLPEGVELMPNGELYGVPLKEGEYTFTVRMSNSLEDFYDLYSDKEYTLTVLDNTNTNVDAATDTGYDLTQRVEGAQISSGESQTLVSQGEYAQFKFVFLDGVKLTEGTDYTSEAGSTRITIRNQTLALSKGRHTIGVEFRTQDESNTLNRAAQNYEIKDKNSDSSDSDGGSDNGSDGGSNNGSDGGSAGDSNGSAGDSNGSVGDSNGSASGTNQGAGSTPNVLGNSQNNPNISNRQTNQIEPNGQGGVAAGIASADGASAQEVVEMLNNGALVSYTIQAGDTLWKIAERVYGSGILWRKIFSDNMTAIGNPNRIYAGQTIVIYPVQRTTTTGAAEVPSPAETSGTTGVPVQAGTYYTIEAGDTLWKIARRAYGRGSLWTRIFEANREQIANPDRVSIGQIIYIPE